MEKGLTVDDFHEVVRVSVAPFWMRPFCCCGQRQQYHITKRRPSRLSIWVWGGLSMYVRPLPIGYSMWFLVIVAMVAARLGKHLQWFFAAGLPLLTLIGAVDIWCQQRRLEKLVDDEKLAEQLLQEGCILSKWFSVNEIQIHPQASQDSLPDSTTILEADESGDRFQVAPYIRGVSGWPRLSTDHPLLWQVGAVLVRLDEAVQASDAKEPRQFGRNFHSQRLLLDGCAFAVLLVIIRFAQGSLLQLFFSVSMDFLAYTGLRLHLQYKRMRVLSPLLEKAISDMEEEFQERTICWQVRLQEKRTFGDVPALEWSYIPASKC